MPSLMIQAPDQASPALHAALYAEWQKFRDGTAPVDPEYIPPFILASWERCRESGITTEANSIVRVDALLLEQALRLNSDLLCSARSIMDKLFSVVRATRCSISLTDGSGLVLHTLRSEGDGPDVLPGQIATEAVSGTNGIGTCLVERKTVTIIGAQHYCARHHVWSCTASPIRYEDGTLAGVLNVSIARESYHPHTRGMVEASAHAIAEQLHLRAILGRQRAIMEVLDEGIIEVDASGEIRFANGRGLSMLGLEALPPHLHLRDAILSEAVRRDILDEHNAFLDRETLLHTANGTLPSVLSFAPLDMGKGGVLALRESRRLCGFAARTIGAGAVYALDDIPGDSPAIAQVREAIRRAARHDAPVLLTGEEGTERHDFAQAIHNAGRRREAPFVAVHCGGIPRSLMRSELFGFDGEGGRPGKCELADGGTLFLDGVEALPLTAQMGIVRLLRGGETARVGGGQGRTVNVRLIAGAGPRLSDAVREGLFLKELYELLREYTITVPPLRERRSDSEALTARCASRFAQALGKQPKPIAPEAMEALLRYPWPGNVRELETVLERAVALAEGDVIGLSDLHARISAAEVSAPTGKPLPGHEAKRLLAALERTAGNVREAAKLLGISRGGFYVKLKKLGLNPDEYR